MALTHRTAVTNDAELLPTVSKADILDLFATHVHPASSTRAKLSIHMRSQKPAPKHVSEAAAGSFAAMISDAGLPGSDAQWREEVMEHGAPTAQDFVKYWTNIVGQGDQEKVKGVFEQLPKLLERYPAEGDNEGRLRDEVVKIEDVKEFRKTLRPSDTPKPLVDWGDLPVSKF